MYLEYKEFHSFIAYLLLAVLVLSIILNGLAWIRKKPHTKINRRISVLALVLVLTQLTMGILLYFLSPLGISNFSGEAMKNATSRLFLVEHPLMMIIGIAVVIFGFINASASKNDHQKNKKMTILFGIGLILILSRIPWSIWF